MEIKKLYEFTVSKIVTKLIESENEDGSVLTKKEDVAVDVPVCIKKPSRRQLEDMDMRYAKYVSKCMAEGIFTKAMLAKSYANMGGTMSDEEKSRYATLYERFTTGQLQLQALNLELKYKKDVDTDFESEETKKLKEEIVEKTKEFWLVHNEISDFENEQAQLFENTAEVIARNKTLLWMTTELTYIKHPDVDGEIKGDWTPFFKGDTYEEKLDFYDMIIDEEDAFSKKVSDSTSLILGFWYSGKATTQEEFDYIRESIENYEISLEEGKAEKDNGEDDKEEKPKLEKTADGEGE